MLPWRGAYHPGPGQSNPYVFVLTVLNIMEWRDRRDSMGISQAALARTARISRTALSLIENGHMRPSVRTSRALERALDPFSDPVRLAPRGGAAAGRGGGRGG